MKVTDDALEPYLERLRALPFVMGVVAPKKRSADGGARLRLKTLTATFELGVVVHGRNLDRVTAALLADRVAGAATPLVVFAPAVSEPIGELFEQRGVAFVDRQGNCSLRLDDRYIVSAARARVLPLLIRPMHGGRHGDCLFQQDRGCRSLDGAAMA